MVQDAVDLEHHQGIKELQENEMKSSSILTFKNMPLRFDAFEYNSLFSTLFSKLYGLYFRLL